MLIFRKKIEYKSNLVLGDPLLTRHAQLCSPTVLLCPTRAAAAPAPICSCSPMLLLCPKRAAAARRRSARQHDADKSPGMPRRWV